MFIEITTETTRTTTTNSFSNKEYRNKAEEKILFFLTVLLF